MLVPKKDGSQRFCVDFHRLNSITRKDVYPLPRVDDISTRLVVHTTLPPLILPLGTGKLSSTKMPAKSRHLPPTVYVLM